MSPTARATRIHTLLWSLLGCLSLALAGCGSPSAPTTPASCDIDQLRTAASEANVVICVIDAARADHVGYHGYPRDTTPNIDRLAEESVVFRHHFAPHSHTTPSTASLFTSLHVDTHLVYALDMMDEGLFTLAKGLGGAGFQTAFFSGNWLVSPDRGFGKDFDQTFFAHLGPRGAASGGNLRMARAQWRKPESLVTALSKWLATRESGRFFAYLHLLPPHTPYDAPAELMDLIARQRAPKVREGKFEFPQVKPPPSRFQEGQQPPLPEWIDLYDANLRYADWGVGGVEKLLRERGLLDNTLLIVTSDHGEAFGEHGYIFHGRGVYDELLHVPMLIRFPGESRSTGDVTALTNIIDLLPSIFDLLQIPYPQDQVQGRSFLPLLSGQAEEIHDYIYARSAKPWPCYLVRDRAWALMVYQGSELRALYNMTDDPLQARNVIEKHPDQASRLMSMFADLALTQKRPPLDFLLPDFELEPLSESGEAELSDDAKRELRALGYLD